MMAKVLGLAAAILCFSAGLILLDNSISAGEGASPAAGAAAYNPGMRLSAPAAFRTRA